MTFEKSDIEKKKEKKNRRELKICEREYRPFRCDLYYFEQF